MTESTYFTQSVPNPTDDQGLWPVIRNRTGAIAFDRLDKFIEAVFCGTPAKSGCPTEKDLRKQRDLLAHIGHGTKAFQSLRVAVETFLLLNCGVYLNEGVSQGNKETENQHSACETQDCADFANFGSSEPLLNEGTEGVLDEAGRLPNRENVFVADLLGMLETYLGENVFGTLPYLRDIVEKLGIDGGDDSLWAGTPLCDGVLRHRVKCPCLIELIWSYWMESAGLVQSMKAIALRFQNRRTGAGRDPLADLDIDPLRPLGNLIWGYIQDEHNRLSMVRRAYEYDHHYGITLKGKAIPELRTADSRSKFLEGFHHLLRAAVQYYKVAEDATKIPDGFPLLNALKEVHLTLAEGAGNQFGDLPWQARVEMLTEQWLLARTEMREFLGGRVMVPYPAVWMGRVDTMRKLQGWGDTSVRYFYDLANFGERLLLSVRYANWSVETDENSAKNWANYWRQEIQGYIHAYRVATGVDLSDLRADPESLRRLAVSPAELMGAQGKRGNGSAAGSR